MKEWHKFVLLVGVFLAAYFLPIHREIFQTAVLESFWMLREYAREHILTCLIPAFFIAGAIACFLSKDAVMNYLGPKANRLVSYSVASVSGTILAVCSCTVLPLFAGIYKRGAGIGPATAFLYSGPAINILAIVLTARVLGLEIGIARAVGAIVFAVVIGLIMEILYGRESSMAEQSGFAAVSSESPSRQPWQGMIYFLSMLAVLIFAAWGKPQEPVGFFNAVHAVHWWLAGISLGVVVFSSAAWFSGEERRQWFEETWTFIKLILPLQ